VPSRTPTASPVRWLVPVAVVLLMGLLVGLSVGGGVRDVGAPGIEGSGPYVDWGLPVVRLVATALGVLVVGLLLYAAVLGPQGRKGVLSQVGRADVVRAGWVCLAWSVASLATAALSLAWALGTPLSETLTPDVVSTYAWSVDSVRAFLIGSLIGLGIAVGCLFTASVTGAATSLLAALIALSLPALTGHSSSLGSHGVAMTSDVVHVLSMSVWVGGLLVILFHAVRNDPATMRAVPVFRKVATWAVVMLGISGAGAAYARMNGIAELWTTSFGLLILFKIAMLAGLLVVARSLQAAVLRAPGAARAALIRFAAVEAVLLGAAAGVGVALTQTPYPRVEIEYATNAETLLGREFPPSPSWGSVVLGWQFEPLFFGLAVLGIGLYLAGVRRLHRRHDRWPALRTTAWVTGWLLVIWSTNAGVATYAMVTMTWHMVAHMSLSMVAPILLAMSAPLTLALRALPPSRGTRRGPREWIVWSMHTPLARLITHPVYVLAVFTVGLYGLYYTPLFSWLMSSHVGHVAMQIHFLASGYLFAWVVIQTDPLPRSLPPWGRLMMVLIAIILHSLFAVPMMMTDVAFGSEWYSQVQPPWSPDLVADSRTAGGIAWGIAEIPSFLLVIAVAVQWARSDAREATRRDRRIDRDGDAELDAYNENLRRLAERTKR
jgi:cytochrome c oxidase assembly factor CtaG